MLTLLFYSVLILDDNSIQSEQIRATRGVNKEKERLQILIAEPEKELLWLFSACLTSLAVNIKEVSSGHQAIKHFLKSVENKRPYDAIILDTHLYNPSGLAVAKRIHSEKPDQQIVLVTTTPIEKLKQECLKIAGLGEKDILTMPFRLSKLISALKII